MILSEKLKTFLVNNKENKICSALFDIGSSSEDFINDIGYLDITEAQDKLSFIPKNRIEKFLVPVVLDYLPIGTDVVVRGCHVKITSVVIHEASSWTPYHYYTSRDYQTETPYYPNEIFAHNRKLATLKKKNEGKSIYDFWNKEIRLKQAQETTVGKLLVKLGLNDFHPKDVDAISALFKNTDFDLMTTGFRFEEWKGEKIRQAYLATSYNDNRKEGSLWSSCMRYDECQKYLDIYCHNDNVRCLVLLDVKNTIHGRAILWDNAEFKIDENNSINARFLDRIYTIEANHEQLFKNYAKKHKCIRKEYNSKEYEKANYFNGNDIIYSPDVNVKLENILFKLYPYVDSVPVLTSFGLSNNGCPSSKIGNLRGTGGGAGFVDGEVCIGNRVLYLRNCNWSETHKTYVDPKKLFTFIHNDLTKTSCYLDIEVELYDKVHADISARARNYLGLDNKEVVFESQEAVDLFVKKHELDITEMGEITLNGTTNEVWSVYHNKFINKEDAVYIEEHFDYILKEELEKTSGNWVVFKTKDSDNCYQTFAIAEFIDLVAAINELNIDFVKYGCGLKSKVQESDMTNTYTLRIPRKYEAGYQHKQRIYDYLLEIYNKKKNGEQLNLPF